MRQGQVKRSNFNVQKRREKKWKFYTGENMRSAQREERAVAGGEGRGIKGPSSSPLFKGLQFMNVNNLLCISAKVSSLCFASCRVIAGKQGILSN